jgi:hypothetical protein
VSDWGVLEPSEPEPEPGSALAVRGKCSSCEKRRMCLPCASCEEPTCRECEGSICVNTPSPRVCQGCYDESLAFARWGPWGPP